MLLLLLLLWIKHLLLLLLQRIQRQGKRHGCRVLKLLLLLLRLHRQRKGLAVLGGKRRRHRHQWGRGLRRRR